MALSQYYGIVQLKQSEFVEYKYRKQKYLLELDKETVMSSGKQKVVEKYQQFYITKQDTLYKGILKNYSIKLADTTNVYDSTKDWIYEKIFNTLEDYIKNILPSKINDSKMAKVVKDYEKYEKQEKMANKSLKTLDIITVLMKNDRVREFKWLDTRS